MTDTPYPVISEHALSRAPRKFISRVRDLGELPTVVPGTVLVFETESGHRAATERRHLTGAEDVVVDAVSVALVDVRDRLVPVQLALPSASAADEFTVTVDFVCRVTRPEVVAAAGLRDISRSLELFLRRDSVLGQIGATHSVEEIAQVRAKVTAQVTHFCKLRPPAVQGVDVALATVRVQTPSDFAAHATEVRDVQWTGRVNELKAAMEDRDAARLTDHFTRGAAAVAGFAASRGQLDLGEATERAYTEEQNKRSELIKLLQSLPEGAFDTSTIDADQLLGRVLELVGEPPRTGLTPGGPDPARLDALETRLNPEQGDAGDQLR